MGFFDDLFDFAFGWLIPDPPEVETGTEVTTQKPEKARTIYGEHKNIKAQRVRSFTTNYDKNIPNSPIFFQIQWSDGPIESIDQIYLNDLLPTDEQYKLPIEGKNFNSPMKEQIDALNPTTAFLVFHYPDGGVADHPFLTDYNIDGKGNAYSVIVLFWHPEAMPSDPNVTADLRGKKIKNLRNNEVVEYTNDYPSVIYDVLTSKYAGRVPESAINKQSFIDHLWTYDLVERWSGDTEKQPLMACNVVLDGEKTGKEKLDVIRNSCRGFLPYNRTTGQYELIIETDRDSESFQVTTDMYMGDVTISDMPLAERYNVVRAKYKNKEESGKEATIVYPEEGSALATQLLAEDGNKESSVDVTLDCVTNVYEATRAAEIILERSRNALRIKTKLKGEARQMVVGKVYRFHYDEFGLSGKPFILTNKKTRGLIVTVEAIEHQPSIYPWSPYQEFIFEDTELPDYKTVAQIQNPQFTVPTNGEGQLRVTWESEQQEFILVIDGELYREGITAKTALINDIPTGNHVLSIIAVNGLGYQSKPRNYNIVITKTAEQVIQDRLDWLETPQSGATVGSTIGVDLNGIFTNTGTTDVENYFADKVLKLKQIDVQDLLSETATVTGLLRVGTTDISGIPRVAIGGSSNVSIVVNKKDGSAALSYSDEVGLVFNGAFGTGIIKSLDVFTPAVREQLLSSGGGSGGAGEQTGGFFEYATPHSLSGTSSSGNLGVTINKTNTNDVILTVSIKDSHARSGTSSYQYFAPKWRVVFKKGTTVIHTKDLVGTAYYDFEPPNFHETWFNIDQTYSFTHSPSGLTDGGTQEYNVEITRMEGSYYDPQLESYSVSQTIQGGGSGGSGVDFTQPYTWDSLQTFNGGIAASSITEGGTALSSKYLGKSSASVDSQKLGGQNPSHYNTKIYNSVDTYLGGYYTSGGLEKPNHAKFGKGKFTFAMLAGTNIGAPSGWYDTMWVSGYSGGDVKQSYLMSFAKFGSNPEMYLHKQNYDSSSWGSPVRVLNSGNYNNYAPTKTGGGASGNWSIRADRIPSRTSTSGSYYPLCWQSGEYVYKTNGSGLVDIRPSDGHMRTKSVTVSGNLYLSSSGRFFNDSGSRVAFTGADFYIQTGVTNYYNYATNQYHGNTSGCNIYYRGNTISGNGWNITGAGAATFGSHLQVNSTITATGQVRGSSWRSTSALKYKDITERVDASKSLELVCKIGSKGTAVGTFKDPKKKDSDKHRWFIADEVNELMPEVVGKSKDGSIEDLNYNEMLPDAYAAISKQQEIIEDQQRQIDELKQLVKGLINGN